MWEHNKVTKVRNEDGHRELGERPSIHTAIKNFSNTQKKKERKRSLQWNIAVEERERGFNSEYSMGK